MTLGDQLRQERMNEFEQEFDYKVLCDYLKDEFQNGKKIVWIFIGVGGRICSSKPFTQGYHTNKPYPKMVCAYSSPSMYARILGDVAKCTIPVKFYEIVWHKLHEEGFSVVGEDCGNDGIPTMLKIMI